MIIVHSYRDPCGKKGSRSDFVLAKRTAKQKTIEHLRTRTSARKMSYWLTILCYTHSRFNDGQKLFYSGDFRGMGERNIFSEIRKSPKDIDQWRVRSLVVLDHQIYYRRRTRRRVFAPFSRNRQAQPQRTSPRTSIESSPSIVAKRPKTVDPDAFTAEMLMAESQCSATRLGAPHRCLSGSGCNENRLHGQFQLLDRLEDVISRKSYEGRNDICFCPGL